ncbi:uncharacterized protein LOC118562598 [Fundulus heteroclitus]|uniref:uncharacterized protein LOC118562598 n=1 Tax=Fundulus heteroclitus TaxID=8078 RepID=UPI00165C6FED|nr:uncharacterized protein LOC118562598 [Fundulus heteroclitus]
MSLCEWDIYWTSVLPLKGGKFFGWTTSSPRNQNHLGISSAIAKMDQGSQRQVPEEMRQLRWQMQRTTALLLDRMEHAPSAPPQSSLPATTTVIQHSPTVFQRVSSRMPTVSQLQLASPCNTPPAESSHTMPGPSCHIPPAPASHLQAVPPQHTIYQPRSDNVQAHLSRLFRPHQGGVASGVRKRKWETPWSHTFICLPKTQPNVMPTIEESCYYTACGLGEKNLFFPHNKGDHSFFSEHFLSAFPPLRDAGPKSDGKVFHLPVLNPPL